MPKRKTVYSWKKTSAFRGDAQEVGEYLENIRKKNKGRLRPEDVFEAAQDPESPIHRYFEWDAEKAIERYGRHTARLLSGSLETTVVITGEEESVRAFVNVVSGGEQYYTTMPDIMNDDEASQYLAQKILERFIRIQEEYEQVRRFLPGIYAAIDDAKLTKLAA